MDHYGAHILATTRRAEFATEAATSRLAATMRERSAGQAPAPVNGWRVRLRRPATT